ANDRRHRRRRGRGARGASASRRALLRIHARRRPVADGGDGPRHLPPAHRAAARALPAEVRRSRRSDPGLRSLDEDLRGHHLQPAMTSAQENELLTRTGAGTLMGELFRRYWLPVLLAAELPEPDCAPVRVKLLGERLIAL